MEREFLAAHWVRHGAFLPWPRFSPDRDTILQAAWASQEEEKKLTMYLILPDVRLLGGDDPCTES